jgi:hypothetical protein
VEMVEPLPSTSEFSVPALDTSSAEQLKIKRGLKPSSSMSHAELFAENLPSARRIFALQIIQQYATDWAAAVRARRAPGPGADGTSPMATTNPRPEASSLATAAASDGLRRSRVTLPAVEQATVPIRVARPTTNALRVFDQGHGGPRFASGASCGGRSQPSGSLAVQNDGCSTMAGYAASHAQSPSTGQSYSQHQRKLQDALTEEVRDTTPNERQAIKAAIKAQREAAEASARSEDRAHRPAAGSTSSGKAKGGRGRDKVMV